MHCATPLRSDITKPPSENKFLHEAKNELEDIKYLEPSLSIRLLVFYRIHFVLFKNGKRKGHFVCIISHYVCIIS